MAERIRHASIYIDGKKIATMTQSSYGGKSGDEAQITDGGYFGHSDGAMTTTLSVDTIEPVRESDSKKIVAAIIQKKDMKMSVALVAGAIHAVTMRCVSYQFDSDPKAGTLTGKFEWEGGEPEAEGLTI